MLNKYELEFVIELIDRMPVKMSPEPVIPNNNNMSWPELYLNAYLIKACIIEGRVYDKIKG